jgi:hypothetical protein
MSDFSVGGLFVLCCGFVVGTNIKQGSKSDITIEGLGVTKLI